MNKSITPKFHLFIYLLLLSLNCYPQLTPSSYNNIDKYDVLDSAQFEATYKLQVLHNPKAPNKVIEDVCILQLGDKMTKSYSKTMYENDSVRTAWTKRGARNTPSLQEGIIPIEVFKQYPSKDKCTVIRRASLSPVLMYEENMPFFNWTIHPEKLEILSYKCQRATMTFRGREYEAWFTLEIPFSEGPWKFGGLPGLILQLQDNEQHYIFECTGIKKYSKPEPIKLWKLDYQKVTRKEYKEAMKVMYEKPYIWAKNLGVNYVYSDGTEAIDSRFPYNPLELE